MSGRELHDLLGVGIYTLPEAAHLIRIRPARLQRWFQGYQFSLHGRVHWSPAVIDGELPIVDDVTALSFLDLQEARCVHEFRRRGVGWRALRDAHDRAKAHLGTDHPFCTGQFKTLGRRIMWDAATDEHDGALLDLAKSQTAFRSVLAPYLRGLEFVNNRPEKWFPLEGSRRVVIDPQRRFGHPIVAKRGVPTAILRRAYRAEGSIEAVARWYEVDVRSVRDAVRYEDALAA
jgi:uncharacterized protein (DUF433 family)